MNQHELFSLWPLKDFQKIGEGTYGEVFQARCQLNGKLVAVKKIKVDPQSEGIPSTVLRETTLLRDTSHPNIVRLYDVRYTKDHVYLLFEFLDLDLKQLLERQYTRLSHRKVKLYMFQLLRGLQQLHSSRILHRDLKPANILVDAMSDTLKLADFGLGRAASVPTRAYTHEVVTLWYRAPEILLGDRYYSTGVDIWALGCIMAELLTGSPLFLGQSEIDQLLKIFQLLGTPNEYIWPGISLKPNYIHEFPKWQPRSIDQIIPVLEPEGLNLLQSMLKYPPGSRIEAKDALAHPYFNEITKKLPSARNGSTVLPQHN